MVDSPVVTQYGDSEMDWLVLTQLNDQLVNEPILIMCLGIDRRAPRELSLLNSINVAEKWSEIGQLIQLFSSQSTSIRCDRINSILSIAKWIALQNIVPNYQISTEEVYFDYAISSIEHDANLDN